MNRIIYNFEDLAEEIFFRGMTQERFDQIAILKAGKTLDDVNKAMREGRMRGLGDASEEFPAMEKS